MADSLEIPLERYKKYEHRSLLPHYLVAKFCELATNKGRRQRN